MAYTHSGVLHPTSRLLPLGFVPMKRLRQAIFLESPSRGLPEAPTSRAQLPFVLKLVRC
jgi:hypothetical protein